MFLLKNELQNLDAKPCHVSRVLRAWLLAKPIDSGPRSQASENFLPLKLRQALPLIAEQLDGLARVDTEQFGAKNSSRLLIRLADNQCIESVLLPRDGLCVSTQVGCAVGCVFCQTGQSGLLRHLSSREIAAQLVLARRRRRVKKVVFMGMGEPAHNLQAVLEAIDIFGKEGGIGHKNLVLSTVGDRRVFSRLLAIPPGDVRPALAISLHSTDINLRYQLLPNAERIAPKELVALGEHYARFSAYPIQYQWTVLSGVNDTDDELDHLIDLLRGKYAMMNFIAYNAVDGRAFKRPPQERLWEMVRKLHQHGIVACLRDSAGQDIEGACGQLRARAL